MRKIHRVAILVCITFSSGCSLLKPFVGDIDGWDLSACADRDGFKVCKELFLDNQEKILGGKKVIDVILDNMNNRTEVMEVMAASDDN